MRVVGVDEIDVHGDLSQLTGKVFSSVDEYQEGGARRHLHTEHRHRDEILGRDDVPHLGPIPAAAELLERCAGVQRPRAVVADAVEVAIEQVGSAVGIGEYRGKRHRSGRWWGVPVWARRKAEMFSMIGGEPDDGVAGEPQRDPPACAALASGPADVADRAGVDPDPETGGGAARHVPSSTAMPLSLRWHRRSAAVAPSCVLYFLPQRGHRDGGAVGSGHRTCGARVRARCSVSRSRPSLRSSPVSSPIRPSR
jgi:hypothetical protein